ncbi:MAG TPA: HlyD family efflux transporter periplasmic adaptor subunit, partial [Flavitalea sp.]|nr:HlyD family efflux transporter periplasmic adaptor subunit [Flavitalea sp.]
TATTVAAIPTIMPVKPSSGGDGMNGMNGSSSGSTVNTSSLVPASPPVLLREGQYVSAGQSLFTVYQSNSLVAVFALQSELAARVKKGQKILYYPTANKNDIYTGTIALIEPVQRNGQNFTLARVYVNYRQLQVGQLLTAHLPIVYKSGWWVPKKAVWRLGNKTIVFKKENNVFIPMEVKPGVDANDKVQIISNIDDWQIASNAYYLIDSESFIKTNNQAQQ